LKLKPQQVIQSIKRLGL